MAVHFATTSDYLKRTTSLLPASGNSTVCFWAKFPTVSTSPAHQVAYAILDDPAVYTNYTALYANSGNAILQGTGPGTVNGTPPTADTWSFYAWTQSGTTQRLYINATSIGTFTLNRSAFTNGFEFMGGDTITAQTDVTVAYCREWTTALSAAQLLLEMQATSAVHTSNLYMDCPFSSTVTDQSGNGHDWTQIGSGSFVSDPSIPTNSSAATATAFATLPQTITQDFGDGLYAWYSYTGHADELMAGFWAYSDIATENIGITVYESDGTTSFLSLQATNKPIQVPQSEGTLLYLYVHKFGSTPPSVDVTLSAVPGPTSAVPIGAIFDNDDTSGFFTAVVSPTNGANYQVLRFFDVAVTNSELGGDVLENGRVLLADDDDRTFKLFNGQLDVIATVSGLTSRSNSSVRTCVGAQVFYVGNSGTFPGTAFINRVDGDGIVTDTWTLPALGLVNAAASNDESIIYTTGQSSSINAPIQQWNPNTNTFGANLVAGVASYTTNDLMVLGDDSVLAIYQKPSGGGALTFVRRYDAAGATLNTYNFTTNSSFGSLFHALDDPTTFWLRLHDEVATDTCSYYNIVAATGVILATVTQATFDQGIYSAAATASPVARFGLSTSCPSFILREAISPPLPPTPSGDSGTEYLIRRERWFPHIGQEQMRQFFSKLQIDLYAGNGISTGQGSDPLLEIDWSDDGGHTWSDIHFVQTGAIGAFRTRAILRRMGSSRDRVYRIACTDPVAWVVVNGYLDAVLGTS
jgi:hypothetical protein